MKPKNKSGGKHAAHTGETHEQGGGSNDATSSVQQDAALQSGMEETAVSGAVASGETGGTALLAPPPAEAPAALPPTVQVSPVIQSADVMLGQVERVVSDLLAQKQQNELHIEQIVLRLGKFGFGPDGESPQVGGTNGAVAAEPAVPHKRRGKAKAKNGRKVKAAAASGGGGAVTGTERPRGWVKQQCVKIVSTHKAGISGPKITEIATKQGISPKDISGGLQAARRSFDICYLTEDGKQPGTGKGGLYFPANVVAEAVMKEVIAQIEKK